jgi:pimeloyl-ACP methyl ester carboxylesterase
LITDSGTALDLIGGIEGAARRHATPCGTGEVTWREWGEGSTVVLLHGGFGSWLHWIRNVEALSARHRVLAVDLPGLGDSALPPGSPTPESVSEPVARGLQSLLANGEACDLVGFSFGGLIAGQVAAMLAERVRSLTLVGASGLGLARRRVDLVPRTPDMSPEAVREAQLYNLRALLVFDPQSADELALAVQAHNDERARIKSRRISLGDSLRTALPKLRGRLNGIWGEHDVTASPGLHLRRELLASLHPELDFHVVAGAGHWVQFEASDAFNAIVLRMLERR